MKPEQYLRGSQFYHFDRNAVLQEIYPVNKQNAAGRSFASELQFAEGLNSGPVRPVVGDNGTVLPAHELTIGRRSLTIQLDEPDRTLTPDESLPVVRGW